MRPRIRTRVLAGAVAAAALGLLPAIVPAVPASADVIQQRQQSVFNIMKVSPATEADKGAGVTVAVLDSGVDPNVSDLTGSVIPGKNFTGVNTPSSNPKWGQHGTWMASIIAAHGHDGGFDGVLGIAPAAKVLSVRVIPDGTDPHAGQYDGEPEAKIQLELAQGIRYAVDHHAQVISMSIGYTAKSGVVRAAVDYAYAHGVVLVASSGNSGNDVQHGQGGEDGMAPVSYPADYPGVIGVGAVGQDGKAASFSSGNLSVRVAAPGEDIYAQGRGTDQYYTVAGTSPACALVAGVAALLKSRYPKISPAQVADALTSTAQRTGSANYNYLTGFGIVHAGAALAKAGQLVNARSRPSPGPSAPYFGGGRAAQPAAPVTPRGGGDLVVFVILLLASAAAAGAGIFALSKRRSASPEHGEPA